MANCKNWKAGAPQASVWWVCGHDRADCLANFSLEFSINGYHETVLPIGDIYRHIAADHPVSNYGLHGVLCVTFCGISGMRDAVSAATGKSVAVPMM